MVAHTNYRGVDSFQLGVVSSGVVVASPAVTVLCLCIALCVGVCTGLCTLLIHVCSCGSVGSTQEYSVLCVLCGECSDVLCAM